MKVITTIPPYAPYLNEIASHELVEGFRLNTVMPIVKESLEEMLTRIKGIAGDKPLWIDLKCRQLRVNRGAYYDTPKEPTIIEVEGKKVVLDPSKPRSFGELRTPPWSIIELDHTLELDTKHPVKCYFNDGEQSAYIVRVEGNKLTMLDGPQRLVGGGESVNIMHPSLNINGFFTDNDRKYIEAAKKSGVHTYMLSYVEKSQDITDLLELDPLAEIVAKIESPKGLDFVNNEYNKVRDKGKVPVRLMAARGDLYVEVGRPHYILNSLRKIVEADKDAIVASRIMGSLRNSYTPACSDITDIGYLMEIGYKNFMIGDDVCFKHDTLTSALNVMKAVSQDYVPRDK